MSTFFQTFCERPLTSVKSKRNRSAYLFKSNFVLNLNRSDAVVSRLLFYKNIARLLLRNFADNCCNYKANFLRWFPTRETEANYSYQPCFLIKKCLDDIQSEQRAYWQDNAWRKNQQCMLHIFINIVHLLIFVDKCWFKVTNLLFIILFMCIFKSGLAANECHESSKSTTKLVDILSVYLSCKGYYLVFLHYQLKFCGPKIFVDKCSKYSFRTLSWLF